ncbi:MAG: MutS-related protein [Brevinematia bacterium]
MKIDNISIRDLELFGIYENGEFNPEKGIISFYNLAKTREGKLFVEKFLKSPALHLNEVEKRQKILLYFVENINHWEKFTEHLELHEFDEVRSYLNSNLIDFFSKNILVFLYRTSQIKLLYENIIDEILNGINSIIHLSQKANQILELIETKKTTLLNDKVELIKSILELDVLKNLRNVRIRELSIIRLLKIDHRIRFELKGKFSELIGIIAEFDGRMGLAKAFVEFKLCLPAFINSNEPFIETKGLFHPLLKKPVRNSIDFSSEKNFLFLTGPNMAGKTTFLKTIGICIYLAHTGFGVPAEDFKLSFFDRLITLMLSEENISKGQSYFMSEVYRVKKIAKSISRNERCIILMDELFKGTNFEDAYETTRSVISKMVTIKSSIYILSTHIFELAEELKKHKNVIFKCFDATIEGGKVKYHYSLTDGISKTKLGMKILENEGVLDIFNIREKKE